MNDRARLAADYRRFHGIEVESGDVDPVYPVYRALAARLGLSAEDRTALVFTHVAYYHAGSALAVLSGATWRQPTGTERRAHRDHRQLRRHLDALDAIWDAPGGFTTWLAPAATDWATLVDRLESLHGNGRWASYKTAEMLQKICGYPVTAPDMGHANSTGPRHGLALLYDGLPAGNTPADIAQLDAISAELAASLGAPVEVAETTLCDFHALHGGRYYPGHDIDLMLAQLLAVKSPLTGDALAARAQALPAAYLGEAGGWGGVDRARKRAYRDTGTILPR